MQIRVATRQDEPVIRQMSEKVNVELGYPELNLTGKDVDLMDIEAFYFWNDGLFIVAEDEGEIVGIAGARRGENEKTLELVRLVVIPSRRHSGIGAEMVYVTEFFAANSQYNTIVFYPGKHGAKDESPYAGFERDPHHQDRWVKDVSKEAQAIACRQA